MVRQEVLHQHVTEAHNHGEEEHMVVVDRWTGMIQDAMGESCHPHHLDVESDLTLTHGRLLEHHQDGEVLLVGVLLVDGAGVQAIALTVATVEADLGLPVGHGIAVGDER